jgi:coproporphyrinogen III oxidase-like Fe-S oxidoreductase
LGRRRWRAGELTGEQLRLEAIFLGVRTRDGIDLKLVQNNQGREAVLQEIIEAGLAEVRENRLIPTREGFVVADRLTLWLME